MKRFNGRGMDAAAAPSRTAGSRRLAPKYALRLLAHSASWASDAVRATSFRGAQAQDFEDFVSEERGLSAGVASLPDPSFRESLRRRLWRSQVLGRRNRVSTTH